MGRKGRAGFNLDNVQRIEERLYLSHCRLAAMLTARLYDRKQSDAAVLDQHNNNVVRRLTMKRRRKAVDPPNKGADLERDSVVNLLKRSGWPVHPAYP
ncbi:MAG TPA: hypothetical protein VKB16_09875 [Beijerinckiaceae bacterium]|nr:hypothetical protein [Beijerinckiaceae bacterium]